ncbi:uncharacterized protein LOC129944809 [Eupeodes corollae]|uniref:uncharacterized protein LOC129944809 n=1 Tax=Eupeodes corollae TaxID=290404 RepID=UPI002490B8BA|nr:uncharacterized protein LOC129944809 [Eupeodes corollae]
MMSSRTFKCSIKILIVFISINMAVQHCYKLKLLSCNTTDTFTYGLNISLYENSTLTARTIVRKDIQTPIWKFVVLERSRTSPSQKIHYNGVIKTCDILNVIKRIRFLRELAVPLFNNPEKGNLSFKCPLRTGHYMLRDIDVPAKTGGVLKYLYTPNAIYTFDFKIYQQLPRNRMEKLCTLELNATIIKSC